MPLVLTDNLPASNHPTVEPGVITIILAETDMLDLKKIASTKAVASLEGTAFTGQAHGVVDTVLNRVASGKGG
ncbi:hypothetical protein GCM10007880_61510 [Mesorhizobium amorphae]|uniref:hypothetical protein n=1 Tax=Mesorhizobium amorphae TaxID=71433 RepID=UPI00235BF544|nr:hypothetical protein [Mesorhizobium amorphae]GLR45633.1 hypothetical protein GCM10007880_61510 [Mesorhizobium amorphae]